MCVDIQQVNKNKPFSCGFFSTLPSSPPLPKKKVYHKQKEEQFVGKGEVNNVILQVLPTEKGNKCSGVWLPFHALSFDPCTAEK